MEAAAWQGTFTMAEGGDPVVLLSAGIGVTMLLSILDELAMRGQEHQREIWRCYGARNGEEHPLAQEGHESLQRLAGAHSRFCVSKPRPKALLTARST